MRKKLVWWGLTALWCIFIFYMSGKPGDESSMESGFIVQLLNGLAGFLTGREDIHIPAVLVRKGAHYSEYFILGLLLYRSICNYKKAAGVFWISAAAGIFYAITDELHQYFIPGRAMRAFDVAIDSLGVLSAVCISYYLSKRRSV